LETAEVADELPQSLSLHVENCRACREEWATLQSVNRLLEKEADQPVPPTNERLGRTVLMSRLREEETPRPASLVPLPRQLAVAGLGIVVIGGTAWVRVNLHSRNAPLAPSTPQVATAPHTPTAPKSTAPSQDAAVAPKFGKQNGVQPPSASSGSNTKLASRTPGDAPKTIIRHDGGKVSLKALLAHDKRNPSATQTSEDDIAYVNSLPATSHPEVEKTVTALINRGDDFITVPLPRLAAANPEANPKIIRGAMKQYEDEQKIVDARLFQKVNVELKGGDLGELVKMLTQKTGVNFYVSKDLSDLKLTVIVNNQPVRDLMRQVVRLFNLQWRRLGEDEGKYRYELVQSLKQRLEEEALRRSDEDQMLLNVVDEMEPYLPYKDKSEAELRQLAQEAKTKVETAGSVEEREKWRDRLRMFDLLTHEYNRDMLKLFSSLSPEQLLALRNGQSLKFTHKGDGSESTLPPDMAEHVKNGALNMTINKPISEYKLDEVNLDAAFSLDRDRPDQVALSASWSVEIKGGGMGSSALHLINGRPDRLRTPGNAASHAAFKKTADWNVPVSLQPQSEIPEEIMEHPEVKVLASFDQRDDPTGDHPGKSKDWVDAADFFADLHKKTGRNIVADYYTRVYPRNTFTVNNAKLLDTLNEAADALLSDWQADGDFLRFRRFNYYSEREMDVPNHYLQRWAANRARIGHMTLDDLVEAKNVVPENARHHQDLKRAVLIKYGLDEWPLLVNQWGILKIYSLLTPVQRTQVQTNEGLLLGQLNPPVAREIVQEMQMDDKFTPEQIAQGRLHLRLRPPGKYEWRHFKATVSPFPVQIVVSEPTREQAEAAIEKLYPGATAGIRGITVGDRAVRGPGAGLEAQLQVGDQFRMMAIEGQSGAWSNGGTIRDKTADSSRNNGGVAAVAP
jgi:hypothetical protein